jgi:hypothetical protein
LKQKRSFCQDRLGTNIGKLKKEHGLFMQEAEEVAKKFLLMRRSLAPTLTAAARQVTLDGTPLVRRCDLIWPEHSADGANSSAQYLPAPNSIASIDLSSELSLTLPLYLDLF